MPGEHQLICVRRHPSVLLATLTLSLVGLVVTVLLNRFALSSTWRAIIWLAWGVLLLRTVWKMASWSVEYLVVTPVRILLAGGLVFRKVSFIPLSAITDFRLRRPPVGLVFGYGDFVADSNLDDQPRASLGYVPFPEEVYLLTWLGPDPRHPIEDLVARISKSVAPVSPFKIVRLLGQASGNQVTDSPAVSRELLYQTVADQLDEDESRRGLELSNLADYGSKLRKQDNAEDVRLAARYLTAATVSSAIVLGLLLGIKYSDSVKPISLDVVLTLLVIAGTLSLLLISLIWLLTHRIDSLDRKTAQAAQHVEKQIGDYFESIALKLSEKLRNAGKEPKLQLVDAPTLIELESARVQPFASFKNVIELLRSHRTSAVGIAGRRGVGKTALLRWMKYELEHAERLAQRVSSSSYPSVDDPQKWIVIYISAPAVYNTLDFVRTIFIMTAKEVIQKYSPVLREGPGHGLIEPFRKSSTDRQIGKLSQQALDSIMGSRSDQRTTTTGIAGKGVSLQRGRQFTWTQRERSHPELIAAFKEYLEQYRLSGGRPIAIIIDELDKLTEASEAIAAINGMKDLFHIPNTHFVVSVSEDALHRFVPLRDVFESAFDTIVKLQPPSPIEAWEMLARRSEGPQGFPLLVALFCYAWSGGVPRDTIRTARACVKIRTSEDHDLDVAELAPQIIRQDVAEIVDDTVAAFLEGNSIVDIGGLLALHRQLGDESLRKERSSLEATLDACRFNEPAHDKSVDTVMLRRLSIYAEIGAATLRYFSYDNPDLPDFSKYRGDLLPDESESVWGVVKDLAAAKAALAVYPAAAEWYLSCAQMKMGSSVSPDRPHSASSHEE